MARNTNCTSITGAWDGFGAGFIGLSIIGVIGLLTASIMAGIAVFSAAGWSPTGLVITGSILMAACIAAMIAAVHAGNYYFDHRLVCIEENKCAIGKVIITEKNQDGDNSLDLILGPATGSTTAAEYEFTFWQSKELVFTDHVDLASRGWHLDPKGNRAGESPVGFGDDELPFFHCEIEGSRISNWLTAFIAWLITLMAIAAAAIVLGAIGTAIPIVGAILAIALAILWLLAIIFGFDFGLAGGDASSIDVNNLGDATPTDMGPVVTDSFGNNIERGDIVVVSGRYITDTGHNPGCWNELHPLRGIAKLRSEKDYFSVGTDAPSDLFEQYCTALDNHINNFGTVSQGLTYLEHPKIG